MVCWVKIMNNTKLFADLRTRVQARYRSLTFSHSGGDSRDCCDVADRLKPSSVVNRDRSVCHYTK